MPTLATLTDDGSGLLVPGNIDLSNRPRVPNASKTSTVLSTSFEDDDGREVLVPRVMENGTIVGPAEAWQNYLKTGKHLGIFKSAAHANRYAEQLHEDQAKLLEPR